MNLADLTEQDCYSRIYDWHKKHGEYKIVEVYKRKDAYAKAYLELVSSLPLPSISSSADRDFIFGEVISMLMEWSYQQEDEYGIKMGAYARHALNKKYTGFHDPKFQSNKETSHLFKQFAYEVWKKKFSDD